MFCVKCLQEKEFNDAEIIWNGSSYCIKHAVEAKEEAQVLYDKLLNRRKKK